MTKTTAKREQEQCDVNGSEKENENENSLKDLGYEFVRVRMDARPLLARAELRSDLN